jgi:hypothetical protein
MFKSARFPLILIFVVMIMVLGGCNNAITPRSPSKPDAKGQKNDEFDMISLIESSEQKNNPSEAAIHQYQFIYKNKKKSFPSKSSIVNEATLANKSIVMLDTKDIDGNFVLFDYTNENKLWQINGLLTMGVMDGQYFDDKAGLKLPFDQFVVATYSKDETQIWAFANKINVIAIAKYPKLSFDENIGSSLISKGRTLYISENKGNRYLYYFESGQMIVISGNIDKKKMIELADSLPAANSSLFPKSNNQ